MTAGRFLWLAVGVVCGLYSLGYLLGWAGLAVLAFLVAVGALGVAAVRSRRGELVVALAAALLLAVALAVVAAASWPW